MPALFLQIQREAKKWAVAKKSEGGALGWKRCARLAQECWGFGWGNLSKCNRLWLLKNSLFAPNGRIWGDRKCLPNPRRSIVGLPDEILFLRISRVGVLQQPQAFTLIDPFWNVDAIYHHLNQLPAV
jgi:hypothetical protein